MFNRANFERKCSKLLEVFANIDIFCPKTGQSIQVWYITEKMFKTIYNFTLST